MNKQQLIAFQLKFEGKQYKEIDTRMVKSAQEMVDKFDFAANARFNTKDIPIKREIFSTLGSNFTLKGQNIDLQPHPHIKIIKETKKDAPIIGKAFEPGVGGYTKLQLESLRLQSNCVAGLGFEPRTLRL